MNSKEIEFTLNFQHPKIIKLKKINKSPVEKLKIENVFYQLPIIPKLIPMKNYKKKIILNINS